MNFFASDILSNKTYRNLFFAQVIALIGTGLATVALGLLAYDIAGGDAGTVLGTAMAIKMMVSPRLWGLMPTACRAVLFLWRWIWCVRAWPYACRLSIKSGRFIFLSSFCNRRQPLSPRHSRQQSRTCCPKKKTTPALCRSRGWPTTWKV